MIGSIAAVYGGNAYIIDTKAAAFETQNGESVIIYYNPTCNGSLGEKTFSDTSNGGGYKIQSKICVNFIYDLNGNKGPNTVGKDIGFMTALYPFDAQLYAPYPATKPATTSAVDKSTGQKLCTSKDSEFRLPNLGELTSMFVNSALINVNDYSANSYATSEHFKPNALAHEILTVYLKDGTVEDHSGARVWCVKR